MPRSLATILLASASSSDSILSSRGGGGGGDRQGYTENLEMTEEQHLLNCTSSSSEDSSPSRRLGRLRSSFRKRRSASTQPSSATTRRRQAVLHEDDQSSSPDVQSTGDLSRAIHEFNRQNPLQPEDRDAVTTVSGLRSVGTFQTFSSHDTVKASNKRWTAAAKETSTPLCTNESITKSKGDVVTTTPTKPKTTRWKHFKKAAIAVVRSASLPEGLTKQRSKEQQPQVPTPLQSRSRSAGSTETACTEHEAELTLQVTQNKSDELKRGRWDGMDVLSLGSAFSRVLPLPTEYTLAKEPWKEDNWTLSCIGASQTLEPAAMVQAMLRRPGNSPPDIILEGYVEADRWSLRIEQGFEGNNNHMASTPFNKQEVDIPPPPSLAASSSEDDGSPPMPSHKLWSTLWGSEPAPASNLPTLEEIGSEADEDPLLDLAAESSVPIDVDEDTFIVSTPEHLDAIHGIASVPIAAGRFSTGIRILRKILTGLESSVSEGSIQANLRGATCHNIGLLYMWQGAYATAYDYFRQACQERQECCMMSPRNVAVTWVRHGQALFADSKFAQALECFHRALELTPQDCVVRAKILTNAGVAHYHLGDLPQALSSFTQALTIQRKWLDGPVRRESLVYDASVTLSNMGKLYLERGDDAMASFVYEEALLLLKTLFRKEHPLILASLQNLALSKARQGQVAKAIKLLERCRRLQVSLYGTNSAAPVMETCGWMAYLCALEHKTIQAQALFEAVYAWQKAFLPDSHPARQRVWACLEALQNDQEAAPLSWL